MKKLSFIAVLILIVTGCTKKQVLTCDKTEINDNKLNLSQSVKITFQEDIVTDVLLESTIKVPEAETVYLEEASNSLEAAMEKYKNRTGITYKNEKTADSIKISLKEKMADISDSDKQELGINYGKQSMSAVKQGFEEQGFVCK